MKTLLLIMMTMLIFSCGEEGNNETEVCEDVYEIVSNGIGFVFDSEGCAPVDKEINDFTKEIVAPSAYKSMQLILKPIWFTPFTFCEGSCEDIGSGAHRVNYYHFDGSYAVCILDYVSNSYSGAYSYVYTCN